MSEREGEERRKFRHQYECLAGQVGDTKVREKGQVGDKEGARLRGELKDLDALKLSDPFLAKGN